MKFLGLNSPEIFLISIIILTILGTKRIEKGWILFQRLLKFLLSNEEKVAKVEKVGISEPKEDGKDSKSEEVEIIEPKEDGKDSKAEEVEIIESKKRKKKQT